MASKLGARRLARSGGKSWSKYDSTTDCGDMTSATLHVEHKRVESKTGSIRIPREWLSKVTEGARRRARTPSLVITFEGARGHETDWILLPLDIAKRLMDLQMEEDDG